MIVIGIVGAPAGGKSTVARILADLGGTWINADDIARSVLEHPEIESKLVEYFGEEITHDGKRIDRAALARRVFGDDDTSRAALQYLELIVHPPTRKIIAQRIRDEFIDNPMNTIIVLDVPLLFESHWDQWCDEIVYVDTLLARRQEHAAKRGWDAKDLERRESRQLSLAEKRRLSTFVIQNNAGIDELKEVLNRWLNQLKLQLPSIHLTAPTESIPFPNHPC
jgi:dephospho-CoA kinase